MNKTHALIAAALLVGYFVGSKRAGAAPSGPTAHNTIENVNQWWSYAGNWG